MTIQIEESKQRVLCLLAVNYHGVRDCDQHGNLFMRFMSNFKVPWLHSWKSFYGHHRSASAKTDVDIMFKTPPVDFVVNG